MSPGTAVRPRTRMPVAQFDFFGGNKNKKTTSSSSSEAADALIPFKDPATLTPEEERKLKLELSANYRPRTPPTEGEGYIFFQGPSPKTSVQADLPSFFSSENFDGTDLPTPAKVLIPVGGLLFLGLGYVLVTG